MKTTKNVMKSSCFVDYIYILNDLQIVNKNTLLTLRLIFHNLSFTEAVLAPSHKHIYWIKMYEEIKVGV